MGYLDGIRTSYLSKNDHGELQYHPYGIFGKYYKVETNQQEYIIKKKHKFFFYFGIFAFIVFFSTKFLIESKILLISREPLSEFYISIIYVISFLGVFAIYTTYYILIVRSITRHLTHAEKKPSLAEHFRATTSPYSTGLLLAFLLISLLLIALGIFLHSSGNHLVGWLGIGLGGSMSAIYLFALRARSEAKRD